METSEGSEAAAQEGNLLHKDERKKENQLTHSNMSATFDENKRQNSKALLPPETTACIVNWFVVFFYSSIEWQTPFAQRS